MISHVLLVILLAAPAPVSSAANPSQARKALASCLNDAVKTDLEARTEPPAFQAKLAALCASEKSAYRAASVAADVAGGIKRAAAEQNASMDLDDVVSSTSDRYKDFFETNTKPR
ncbi:MAG: hypothetical protein JOZ90_06750 [Alphaproteobacteria bacterium]|nr:hypothetical protein [Alphaproteobacteria bacterium]MBV9371128.1 hypothetical protein [Alphaproteobacteria bacterium]MBV9900780.1 hypothetical protein [Alphaproteobacteria bacterium]